MLVLRTNVLFRINRPSRFSLFASLNNITGAYKCHVYRLLGFSDGERVQNMCLTETLNLCIFTYLVLLSDVPADGRRGTHDELNQSAQLL